MIYSLIPAKKQSSRLPGKNTFGFMLGGKPLIAYTIEAVKNAHITPYVFSDDTQPLPDGISETFGATIIKRPQEVSTEKTTMKETVKSFIKIMGIKRSDIILITYLTCPFRVAWHIEEALKMFEEHKTDSLQSVTEVNYRPYGLMARQTDGRLKCLQDQKDYYQQQNIPKLYRANGAIYIFKVSELNKLNNQMFNDKTISIGLDEISGHDIDTELDFMLAEKILERRNEHTVDKLPCPGGCEAKHNTNWSRANIKHTEKGRTQSFGFRY